MINFVAISSYVLVLTMSSYRSVAIDHVEGFTTQEACQAAGEKARVLSSDQVVKYVCLPKS